METSKPHGRWSKAPDRPLSDGCVVDERHLGRVARYTWIANERGYFKGRVNRRHIFLHRFVWLLEYGTLPARELDHINRNRKDNRIENLRLATRSMNTVGCARNGREWPRGVSKTKNANRWYARLRDKYLGCFSTPEAASAAYERELEKYIDEQQRTITA